MLLFDAWQDFFIADGDGLPRGVVDGAASFVQQVLGLFEVETSVLLDRFRVASEQLVGSNGGGKDRSISMSADTLLRVLCHRGDRDASKFLKKNLKLPKVA